MEGHGKSGFECIAAINTVVVQARWLMVMPQKSQIKFIDPNYCKCHMYLIQI